VARREEERRKALKGTGKVYTNDSLAAEGQPAPPASPAPPVAAAAPASPAAPPSQTTPPEPGPTTPAPSADAAAAPKSEGEWRKRAASVREALSRAQIFAEALQSRINALSTDFVNRDDPAQRDVVAAERQKALAELDRVKKEIQDHQKALTALQDEARRAGVPPGWVR
jgi:hypothetical protein